MIDLKLSKEIFNPVYLDYLNDNRSLQIFYGGSSSGKTYFLAQRAVYDVLNGNRNYLILRKVQRDCRKSVWNEVVKTIKKYKIWQFVQTNKTEMTMTFPNGYQIFFGGLDDRERIKGVTPQQGVITDIWLEEATEFDEDDIKQLEKRLRGQSKVDKRITLSFNPILKTHWIYTRYFDNWTDDNDKLEQDDLLILKTTYRDNEFLTEDDIKRLESEDDPYYIDVYLNGNWGILGDVIFTNWEVKDLSDMEDRLDRDCHGLDFGFSSDPAAVVKQYYDKSTKTLYIFDEIYETELTDEQLANKTADLIGREVVTCDSAEPKSIKHLKNNGVRARGVKKGKGSVETRYRWYKGINIVVDPKCVNIKRELQTHQWKTNKYGQALPKPENKNAHALDASMYGCEEYWQGKSGWGF